ncbi:MAG TPA: proprotein convertase P-domain-containing protein [Phycisphaerae bacterium]|nr:proprotein convertase P-domain-containing protein [Phycisphaerae bacterium]
MSRLTGKLIVVLAIVCGIALGSLLSVSVVRAVDCPDYSPFPPINGQNLTNYPVSPNALQDNPTGFGDSIPDPQDPSTGSELDQLFLANSATDLYIAVTGNTVRNDALENTIIIFIDKDAGATPTILDTNGMTGSNALRNLDPEVAAAGAKLDFDPEYAVTVWNVLGVQNARIYDLSNPTDTGVALTEGTDFAVDNNNLLGVNSDASYDPLAQQNNAATATLGFEFKLSLAAHLGNLANNATIRVQALLVNGPGFISNQSLPPINVTAGNNGGGRDCVGTQNPPPDPQPDPPETFFLVDFSDDVAFPGSQNVSHTLSAGGSAPGGTFNGTSLPTRYMAVGQLRATQNNYTCFGNAAAFQNAPTEGSELDQIFVRADFTKLYIGVTGNVPLFGDLRNTLLIFIDSGSGNGGQTLQTCNNTNGSGALQYLCDAGGGLKFDDGFAPDVVIMYWREAGAHHAVLSSTVTNDFIPFDFSIDNADHINPNSGNFYSADLSNIFGVNNIQGDDPIRQEALADGSATSPDGPTSGMQFSLRWDNALMSKDVSGGTADIKIAAAVVAGGGFISNQWLPPLNETALSADSDSVSYSDAPLPAAIPDNTPAGVSDLRAVTMAGADRITDVNVSVSITHPDVSQLSVTLAHADSGRTVEIVSAGSQVGANLNITFDSEGAPAVQPSNSLLTFNDVNPNSNWTLTVVDNATGQTGTLNSWGLSVQDWEGGDIGCLGNFDSLDNNIDLSVEPYSGNQHLDLSLTIPSATPGSSDGTGIPAAFGGAANALATQNNHTCFGNATTSLPGTLPGSEMDQLRITNTNSRLKVAVTGNLENNGNAFVLMLDTDNTNTSAAALPVLSTPPPVCGGLDGLKLDAGFTPDYAIVVGRDPTAGVPNDDYNVFLKKLIAGPASTTSYALGRLTRNLTSGPLDDAIPNQNGSELDQLFIQNDANRLYIGLTGNLEANNNTFIVFIQTTPTGFNSNELDTTPNTSGWPPALIALDCDRMDLNFKPDFALVMNRNGGTYDADLVDLLDRVPGITVTNLTFTDVLGNNTFIGDNTNAVGVSSTVADDTTAGVNPPLTVQEENAMTATRGVQFAIDRSFLGHPIDDTGGAGTSLPPADGATIKVSAVLVSSTGYWSNQILPGLGGGKNNLAGTSACATVINLDAEATAPGLQYLDYVLRDGNVGTEYTSPSTFTGADIPTAMGPALATQDNYTQFGNAALVNPGNPNCTQIAINNNNIGGVTVSSADPNADPECDSEEIADSACPSTGMEFDIDFADIGLADLTDPGGPFPTIRVMAVLTGSSGYFSNQFLPPLGVGNAGNKGDIPANWDGDLTNVTNAPGNQFLSYTLSYQCGLEPADINGDNNVTSADIDALVGVLLGLNTNPCDVANADVDNSGSANGRDVSAFVPAYLNP